jgi:pimeloyl-ACP methyl ester carboxylesterase
MPQFQRLGGSIHYETLGDGPPLLLLAGIASDGASWGPLIPLIADDFRLILIDNRGSGQTRCEGEIAIRDMVGDAVALLDHLRIETAFVLGHSLGGMLGQRLAAAYPDRVRALVTLTTSDRIGIKERLLFEELARLYFEIEPQRWFGLLFQWLFSDGFFADGFFASEENVRAAAEASAAYPYRQSPEDFSRQVEALKDLPPVVLPASRCPVLAIAAGRDMLVQPAAVKAGHLGIAYFRMITIVGASHSVHWDAPEKVAREVLEFLA